jgi:hypothetical protein
MESIVKLANIFIIILLFIPASLFGCLVYLNWNNDPVIKTQIMPIAIFGEPGHYTVIDDCGKIYASINLGGTGNNNEAYLRYCLNTKISCDIEIKQYQLFWLGDRIVKVMPSKINKSEHCSV